jgi:hypothetical protein
MKRAYRQALQVDALGKILRTLMDDKDRGWDECLYRQEAVSPGHTRFAYTCRRGRELDYIGKTDEKKRRLLEFGTNELFKQIAELKGEVPKVGVLSVQPDGQSRFFYDTQAGAMDITFHTVGLRNGYFTRAEIDPPAFVLDKLVEDAKWETLLDGGATFALRFLASDFGFPCPDDRDVVEEAIARELTAPELGKVIDVDFPDIDGLSYESLRIGVVDAGQGAARIARLMQELPAPASTTLRMIEPHAAEVDMGLKPKAELVMEHTTYLIQELVRESIRCSPASWDGGALTINTDGSWVGYALKNDASADKALISAELKKLCEDLAVILWLKGDRWTRATLRFGGIRETVTFEIGFSYDAPDIPPEQRPAQEARPTAPAKAWWKIW